MTFDAFQDDGFQPLGFQEGSVPAVVGGNAVRHFWPGITVTPGNAQEQQREAARKRRERRKRKAEEDRVAAVLAAMLEGMRTISRQREDDWLLGLITDDEYVRAA